MAEMTVDRDELVRERQVGLGRCGDPASPLSATSAVSICSRQSPLRALPQKVSRHNGTEAKHTWHYRGIGYRYSVSWSMSTVYPRTSIPIMHSAIKCSRLTHECVSTARQLGFHASELTEQLRSVSASDTHQLILPTGVEADVRRDVVDRTVERTPCVVTRLVLRELLLRHADEASLNAAQVLAALRQTRPVQRRASRPKGDLAPAFLLPFRHRLRSGHAEAAVLRNRRHRRTKTAASLHSKRRPRRRTRRRGHVA